MFELTLMPRNLKVLLPRNSSLTELEFELHGVESIPFGCKSGACGACVVEVLSGQDMLGERQASEATFLATLGFPGERYRLACQCRLVGDATISTVAAR